MEMPTFQDLMTLNDAQLRALSDRVWDVIKTKRDNLGCTKAYELEVGNIVEWDSGRHGLMVGEIVKKKIKNAVVDCGLQGRWDVPMGILKKSNKEFKNKIGKIPGPKVSFPFNPVGNTVYKGFFQEGDTVEFLHLKKGMMQGKIVRIKRKKAIVNVGGPRNWDVPFDILRKVNNCGL